MNELSLYIVLSVILAQGLFLLIAIQLLSNKNRQANNILSIILLIANLILVIRIIIAAEYKLEALWRIVILIDATILIFGPLLYCFIRRLLFKETPVFRLSFVHYVPSIAYLIFFLWSLTKTMPEYLEYWKTGELKVAYMSIEIAGIASMAFYIIKSFHVIRISKSRRKELYASDSKVYTFLWLLLMAIGVFCIVWLINFINLYVFDFYVKYLDYNTTWISIGVLMYVVGFYSLTRPEIFRVLKSKEKMTNTKRLSDEEITLLKQKLHQKLDEERLFLDANINLKSLSKALGTTTNNLSWLLNNVYEKKFYEFINEYRIAAFLELIKQDKHKTATLFALAMDVGFNSKSTFNKAFKSVMNTTPSQYINDQEFG